MLLKRLAHYVAGLASALAPTWYHSALAVLLFLAYELVEWRVKHDKAYPEIREFAVGFFIGMMVGWVVHVG